MTTVALNKIVVESNVRKIPGVEDISKVEFENLPSDEQESIRQLANSIENEGLLQPIVVRDTKDGYRLIAGWRRYMAHRLLNKPFINVTVKKVKREDESTIQLVENIHRKDLDPLSVAEQLDRFRRDRGIRSQEALAEFVHKSNAWVSYHLKLLKADPAIQEAVRNKEIGLGSARILSSMPKAEQAPALEAAKSEAVEVGDVDKKTGKPKLKTKGVRRQSRRSKQAKKKEQMSIRPVAEREQEQREEVIKNFFDEVYGQTKVGEPYKVMIGRFWDYLMETRRLVIK